MKYIPSDLSTLTDARAALAKLAGLPRRGTVVGGPDYLPQEYTPGAAGWTDQLVPDAIDVGDGTGLLPIHVDAEKYAGRTVKIGARNIMVPAALDEASLLQAARAKLAALRAQDDALAVAVDAGTQTAATKGG